MGFFIYECSDDVQERISPLLRSQGIEVLPCPLSKDRPAHENFQFSCSRGAAKILLDGVFIPEEQAWICQVMMGHSLLFFKKAQNDVQLLGEVEAILKESGVFKSPDKTNVEEK